MYPCWIQILISFKKHKVLTRKSEKKLQIAILWKVGVISASYIYIYIYKIK